MRSIAAELGRRPSTIRREIGRNTDPATGVYLPHTAHQLAARRRSRPKTTKLAADPVLRSFVDACLGKRLRPEQINHQLGGRVSRRRGPAPGRGNPVACDLSI